MALRHWLHLSLTSGIGPILARRVIEATGDVESACDAPASLLQTVDGIGSSKATKIAAALKQAESDVEHELDRAAAANARIICPDDDEYPVLLKTIPDPPLVLYVRGSLQPRDLNAVAIVGSRKCSLYGREQAERFGALLGGAGITVLSGGLAPYRSQPVGRAAAIFRVAFWKLADRKIRKDKPLSSRKIAPKYGVSPQTIRRWRGRGRVLN